MIIVWLPKAVANRDAQIDRIALQNRRAAIEHDERVSRQTKLMEENPEIGHPGRRKGTRELVISRTNFVVIYRIKAKRIEVVRLLHSSQQWS